MRRLLTTAALAASLPLAAEAETFRWASQSDPNTLDPHATNTSPVLGFLNNVYEGLVRRNQSMAIEPALATSWQPLDGEPGWRFALREGVTFHDGSAFTADDVLFSYERATSEQSDVTSWFAPVTEVRVVDDLTVEFVTDAPNPLFPDSIANFMIMDRGWAEANGAERPARDADTFATTNANGTGAFRVTLREPDIRTVLAPFENWWGEAEHDLTEVIFTPITQASTRVAALLSGEVDLIEPVPLQDLPRLERTAGVKVVDGVEARVMFFGFEQRADRLDQSDVQGNPFQDRRVRRAVNHAIDADALVTAIMRGKAKPIGVLIDPASRGYNAEVDDRYPHDPERAQALLAEAGYPEGFSFGLRCPNDRYINDEAICTAVVPMLARVGLDARLETMPVSNYWTELRAGNFDMYLLGWSPGTFDAEHPARFLLTTPDEEKMLGSWNFGGYSNPRIDELLPQIQTELDEAARQAMIDEIFSLSVEDAAYVPLYVQPLVWGAKDSVDLVQRTDNFVILRWVRLGEG